MIEIKNISFSYEDGTKALKNINLHIGKGEKIAFLGANGSGKSTLFLCLNGILKPQSGEILYHNKSMDYSRKGMLGLRSKVGIVFQDPDNQLFSSSVYQEISFGILNLGVNEDTARIKVENIMEELEITPYKDRPTHLLSGGQKKQVALADILVMEPEVLIMDEPASALDPKHTRMLNETLNNLQSKGITLIVSTHDVDFALEWADRVIVFKEGEVAGSGSPEDIFLDQQLLEDCNLIGPKVIKLHTTLVEQGILSKDLKVPRNLEILEGYLIKNHRD
ncbi:MAG: cobalt chelatase [Anaerocolumna sp.]|jgi:cobalt/nickel transport system ATP-binding protein|nr:cobalt chelatase [Anaerocolumna sp.]